jgi:cell division septation protein DedD
VVVLKRLGLVKSERGVVAWGWLVVLIIVLCGAFVTLKLLPHAPAPEPSAVVARGKIQPMPAPTQAEQDEVPQKTATEGVAPLPMKYDEAPSSAVIAQSSQAPEPTEPGDSMDTSQQAFQQTSSSEDAAEVDTGTAEAVAAQGVANNDSQPDAGKSTPFAIQVGAFRKKGFAENMTSQLKELGYPAFIFEMMNKERQPLYLVRFGHFSSRDVAASSAVAFREKEQMPVLVVVSKAAE